MSCCIWASAVLTSDGTDWARLATREFPESHLTSPEKCAIYDLRPTGWSLDGSQAWLCGGSACGKGGALAKNARYSLCWLHCGLHALVVYREDFCLLRKVRGMQAHTRTTVYFRPPWAWRLGHGHTTSTWTGGFSPPIRQSLLFRVNKPKLEHKAAGLVGSSPSSPSPRGCNGVQICWTRITLPRVLDSQRWLSASRLVRLL